MSCHVMSCKIVNTYFKICGLYYNITNDMDYSGYITNYLKFLYWLGELNLVKE